MRISIVIASHNEGQRLVKTVQSCLASIRTDLDFEIVVADDGSTDGSTDLVRSSPHVRVLRNAVSQGVAGAKDFGARQARGTILVFLDAHCKPEPGAIERLAADVGMLNGQAVVAPRVAMLDEAKWENQLDQCGNGYLLDLETFEERWIPLKTLRRYRSFYDSPNLVGCCLAVSSKLYELLGGFDPEMRVWGCEQVDFGLKAWFLGFRVVNDIYAVIGHRFRVQKECHPALESQALANQMRTARKHFSDSVWDDWLVRCRKQNSAAVWESGWGLFSRFRESAEVERQNLFRRRVHDEFWYADTFNLNWPLHGMAEVAGANGYHQQLREAHLDVRRFRRRPFDANVVGQSVGPGVGKATLFLQLANRLWGGVYVEGASLESYGDDLTALYGSLLVERIEGCTVETIENLTAADLLNRVHAENGERWAAEVVIDALRRALSNQAVAVGADV